MFERFMERFMPFFEEDGGAGGGQADGSQPEGTQGAQPEAPTFTLNYMGEEKTIDLEEAKTLAQKGMNYDPLSQKWESAKTTLSAFEEIARKSGFVNADGHGDIEAFKAAASEQIQQQEIGQFTEGVDLPPELAKELYLSKKFRLDQEAERERKAKEAERDSQLSDLLKFYKEMNGKDYDPEADKLPQEVFIAMEKGIPPRMAYAEHLLREQKIAQANADNGASSPGGIAGRGTPPEKEFFTSEELDRLTSKDLDDPNIYQKAMKSLSKLGR